MHKLPDKFLERLRVIVPENTFDGILKSFEGRCGVVFRINTLKVKTEEVVSRLNAEGIALTPLGNMKNVYSCQFEDRERITRSSLAETGLIYVQSASSLLAANVLNPTGHDLVLDMCAAPGSKTSHMAALMDNAGEIIALESAKPRFFKLKNILKLLGVTNVNAKIGDARRYRPKALVFDKILADVPCSSEGRFHVNEPESYAFWSERKIKEMKHKQKGILLRGLELLRQGGELLYSTCTFAPEENEEVVNWALQKKKGEVVLEPISLEGVVSYPALDRWGKREFDKTIRRCVRIMPQGLWDGFFMAKFRRT